MQKNLQSIEKSLKRKIKKTLFSQGYIIQNDMFCLPSINRNKIRKIHKLPRAKKISSNINFIADFTTKAKEFMRDSCEINIKKVQPKLIQITTETKYAGLFRWWNLVWWSLPYEKSYGRQMRFLVWDEYHDAPIGLIGLQSPILSWNVRDKYLSITPEKRDFLINQSMNAQRLGALPPYNKFFMWKTCSFFNDLKNYKKRI